MSAAVTAPRVQVSGPLGSLLDTTREGSVLGQALTGIVALVLALILVAGQITLATTAGISRHLEASVANMERGNAMMDEVIAGSRPTARITSAIADQESQLQSSKRSLQMLEGQVSSVAGTTVDLRTSLERMVVTNAQVGEHVTAVDALVGRVHTSLGGIAPLARSTKTELDMIEKDAIGIDSEVRSINDKLGRYGFAPATGGRGGLGQ